MADAHRPEGLAEESWDALAPRDPDRSWPVVTAMLAATLLIFVLGNVAVEQPPLWRVLYRLGAQEYVPDNVIARALPGILRAPPAARDGVALLGASNIALGVPQERARAAFGPGAWSVGLPGANPPEFLGLAPYVARAQPRVCLVTLTVQASGWAKDAPFTDEIRRTYVTPLNPAWPYRVAADHPGWQDVVDTIPLLRLRAPLRTLVLAWVRARAQHERPPLPEWREMGVVRRQPAVQKALARFEAERTPQAYIAYMEARGLRDRDVWQVVADFRRVRPDLTGESPNVRALRDLTRYLRDRDIAVAWVLFPENPIYGEITAPDGEPIAPPETRADARAVYAKFAAADDVPFVDLLDLVPVEDFHDLFHVAEPGWERLAPELRRAIELAR